MGLAAAATTRAASNAIWHLFVLLAAACHGAAIFDLETA